MTPVEELVEHARTMARRARHPGSEGWRHGSIHDVVLAHGRVFEPAPLPGDVYPALPGHACQAAAILADRHALTYVEGLALLPDSRTVIEHAWCATFGGQVVDAGLSGLSATAYLGVAFTMKFRRSALARSGGTRPILIGDPAGTPAGLEILKHGLAPETTLAVGKPYSEFGTVSGGAGAGAKTRDGLASAA
ncbi:hypothetical protein KDK95_04530 [Actinospica sp. MGRD01-02]|uniref:Uncharacterized protein n=1 Tax=Actinospica acidithermotolerans TaxID=2828514 RepID=A0A941E5M1_9ACTN|nr:hypothetical protein [Actinospica acidithermotolerans]MBR7825561.1 hypothetical protein [Actinospica acidithermotolerans]